MLLVHVSKRLQVDPISVPKLEQLEADAHNAFYEIYFTEMKLFWKYRATLQEFNLNSTLTGCNLILVWQFQ